MAGAGSPEQKQRVVNKVQTDFAKPEPNFLLRKAARLWGLQTGYKAVGNNYVEAKEVGILSFLRLLSESSPESDSAADQTTWLKNLVRRAHIERFDRVLEPVQVLWTDKARQFIVTVPEAKLNEPLRYTIRMENGEEQTEQTVVEPFREIRSVYKTGTVYRACVEIPFGLPVGYHEIRVESLGAKGYLFVAPRRVDTTDERRHWGLFAPLYSMRAEGKDWGIGDLSLMNEAQKKIRELGGSFLGTLPMLASAGGSGEYDPSPYSPVSRLFWNEIFLDVDHLIQKQKSPRAEALVSSPEFKAELEKVRAIDFVDYPAVFALKKRVLKLLATEFFEGGGADRAPFRGFVNRTPQVKAYADFRSGGDLNERDYHIYVQYEMDARLNELGAQAAKGEASTLYLDFPVGVSRSGFDAHHFKASFLNEVTAGAPPDAFFSGGQNWGFSPFHPNRIREEGYQYFANSLRNHMRFGKILRLDHIMGLHRIYSIAEGSKPNEGVYVRFKTDEFFACLMIEAERAGVRIVGENLGTVPEAVGQALINHDCLGMWVLPFEAGQDPAKAIAKLPERNLACLNTHDMVPFKGHVEVRDLELFEKLGVLDPEQGQGLRKERKDSLKSWMKKIGITEEHALLKRLLEMIAVSPAELLLINLEDLWDETEPQNIPGTWNEYPNWRKKLKYTFSEWTQNKEITEILRHLSSLRSQPLAARETLTTESKAELEAEQKDKTHVASGKSTNAAL